MKSAKITALFVCLLFYYAKCTNLNNVCPTFKDYHTVKNNTNCWYDFAADSSAVDIIKKSGYPVEEHKVTTGDGYILTIFRIPNAGKQPVFLLHGVTCTAANFIGLGKQSLAFLLWDAGYDVWLGNFRGTEYSEGHVNLTVHDRKYWDHGIDEIAIYDVPSMLKAVSQHSGNKGNIIYIGHSLGTTLGLMYASEFPKEAKNTVKLFIHLSPSYKLANMKSPVKFLRPFLVQAKALIRDLHAERLVEQAEPSREIIQQICLESPELMRFCLQLSNMFFGRNTQMGPEIVPVFFNQLPGGTSLRVYNQVAQQIRNKFTKYDFGKDNFKKYGQDTPPEYDISKIKVPCYIIYSTGDWATTKQDAIILYNALPEIAKYGMYEVKEKNFNHMDFVFGRNAKEQLYDHILKVMRKFRY